MWNQKKLQNSEVFKLQGAEIKKEGNSKFGGVEEWKCLKILI